MAADADLLDAVQDEVYRLLVRHGVEEVTAVDEASALRAQLQKTHGGKEHYLPALDRTARQRQILADLARGSSEEAVAAKHGVSLKTVQRAKQATPKNAPDLLGFGKDDWVL